MQWITALLAFATTMLMFAIIVSTLVEMVHRIFHLRSKGLHLMLENLYERVIEPKLKAAGQEPSGTVKDNAKKFAETIMQNRAATGEGSDEGGLIKGFFRWFADWAKVTDIPVEVFTQKLADSKVLGEADKVANEVVQDIAQKYEAFGNEISSYFESRARVFSVLIAFAVAWMFYVHPYKLAVTYFKNPELAQMIADRAPELRERYDELTAAVEAAKTVSQSPETTRQLEEAIENLKDAVASANKEAGELRAVGAPVGWGELAACGNNNAATAATSESCSFDLYVIGFPVPTLKNAFWLLVGGLMVGLGAPFWAQAVSSLTASRDISGKIAAIVAPARAAPAADPVTATAPAGQPVSPAVAAFKVAGAK